MLSLTLNNKITPVGDNQPVGRANTDSPGTLIDYIVTIGAKLPSFLETVDPLTTKAATTHRICVPTIRAFEVFRIDGYAAVQHK